MAFVDELKIHISAGKGGNGIAAWLHEKSREFGGPAGGDGGNGGNVYVRGVRDIGILAKYRNEKEFRADNGQNGLGKNMFGKKGKDLIIDLPVGSVITNENSGKEIQLLKDGEEVFLLKGGRGGWGNTHFKGSKNVKPRTCTPGKPGEDASFYIELQLMADAGLIGLPNAGKSSLLNELTNASAKIGAYQFTTLEPNLGAFYGFILADIPGLIEGASEGRGLGDKFLRHIRRTKILLHCVSLENEDLNSVYKTIREELKQYDEELIKKQEIIILTKTDTVTPAIVKKAVTAMKKKSKQVFSVSIIDDASVKKLREDLMAIFEEKA
jgi:GTP-binding protein